MRPIRVAIWGFGAMGQGMAEMLLTKRGVDIVGVCDHDPTLVGRTVQDVLTQTVESLIPVTDDIDLMLNEVDPDIVLLCTDSFVSGVYEKIKKLLEKNINVITIAEEMVFPFQSHPALAKELDDLAKEKDVTVLGTGINPGFVMDFLAIALSGAMMDVEKMVITRKNSLNTFGLTVMEKYGIGETLEQYYERITNKQPIGHIGLNQSAHMIFSGVGLKPSKFEQQIEPILTQTKRKTKYATAKEGTLAGISLTGQGYIDEQLFLELHHPSQIEPDAQGVQTEDSIYLEGKPNVNMTIRPEIDGGLGTIAVCVNMIPHVMNAKPGLKTMLDLPVPRAILGDMRDMLETIE
ncbi:MAG: 2,4-diaminopentanoate dehydrogenase [Acholeplasmataceae bacterium]|nr:2,4-diaminopentanoate dehydrogenase [Acholeplasmataceae bacterium]